MSQTPSTRKGPRNARGAVIVGTVVALLFAGIVSFYASGSPDGLERVSQDKGFADTASEPLTKGSPFADYGTRGVDNERVSGGLAGVVGVLVVLAAGTGLALVVRRRRQSTEE